MFKKKLQNLISKARIRLVKLPKGVIWVGLFTLVGVVLLIAVRAASPYISIDPESQNSSGVVLGSDANASGGGFVQFKNPPCPAGQTGTPPNCVTPTCPPGQIGTYPNCTVPPPTCPPGQVGTYPNCVTPIPNPPHQTGEAVAIAFCGVHPQDPSAQKAANTMAQVAGIDATMGPCMPPPANYSAAFPGTRYVTREVYRLLVVVNANAGMKTIVYDPEIWTTDPVRRAQVIDFWNQPMGNGHRFMEYIWGWDMGDEFYPHTSTDTNARSAEWNILVQRWNIMIDTIIPLTGVGPYTNHLGYQPSIDFAISDLKCVRPNSCTAGNSPLSFDYYPGDQGESLARNNWFKVVNFMCYVNTLNHAGLAPTQSIVIEQISRLRSAGCNMFGIFGGHTPYSSVGLFQPDPVFGTSSLVDSAGNATPLASAVKWGTNVTVN